MNENRKSSHIRTSSRGRGRKLSAAQRNIAQEAFLQEFEQCSTILDACVVANIDRSTFQNWLEHDEEFSFRYNQAKASSDDVIRRAIKNRAIDGWQEPIVSMGKVVFHDGQPLTVTKYSDALLALLAKSRMPEYREKQQVDVNTNTNSQDMQAIHTAIAQALTPYPDAKIALADALDEVEKAHGSR